MSKRIHRIFVFSLTTLFAWSTMAFADEPAVNNGSNGNTQIPMTDIHDIKPLVKAGQTIPWKVILAIFIILVLISVLYLCWRRFRRPINIADVIPVLPPEVNAYRALDQIGPLDRIDGKAFYFTLSAILRQYLFERFGFNAPEMTTEELLPQFETLQISPELYDGLVRLCRGSDPIKYAGERPQVRQMELDLGFVRNFINATVPKADEDMPADNQTKTLAT